MILENSLAPMQSVRIVSSELEMDYAARLGGNASRRGMGQQRTA